MTETRRDRRGAWIWFTARAKGTWQRLRTLPFKDAIDITAKLAAPVAVLVGALLAQSFQSSLSATQLLAAREDSDTKIRAEMFKAITEKLLGNKDKEPPPERKAVFTELLALNFHEHFELKPLMVDVDDALLAQLAKPATKADERTRTNNKRLELLSVARRVRARQTAMLIRPYGAHAVAGWAPWSPNAAKAAEELRFTYGDLRMISVRFTGRHPSDKDAVPSPCDVPKREAGQSACFTEPVFENAPDGQGAISIAVNKADWKRQAFTLLITSMAHQTELSPQEKKKLEDQSTGVAPRCDGLRPNTSSTELVATATAKGSVEFEITWFDLPLTDNTPLWSGSRYAIFIDRVCPEDGGEGEKVVKLALMWFPKDYFPPRERPTNYRQFREKLNLPLGQ